MNHLSTNGGIVEYKTYSSRYVGNCNSTQKYTFYVHLGRRLERQTVNREDKAWAISFSPLCLCLSHKTHMSPLPGVYARENKKCLIVGKCVTCCGLHLSTTLSLGRRIRDVAQLILTNTSYEGTTEEMNVNLTKNPWQVHKEANNSSSSCSSEIFVNYDF